MIKNSLGRELPEKIGDYVVRPYQGAYAAPAPQGTVVTKRVMGHRIPGDTKLLPDLEAAIKASGLRDGMTISFHHSFREGDMVIGQVLTAIRELGIKHLRFAPSAVVNIKNPSIVDFVRDGTIDRIEASGIRGQLGDAVLAGEMENPVILRTHGARPRAIEAGELQIDVAFIGASASDDYGNCTGQIGPNGRRHEKLAIRAAQGIVEQIGRVPCPKLPQAMPGFLRADGDRLFSCPLPPHPFPSKTSLGRGLFPAGFSVKSPE